MSRLFGIAGVQMSVKTWDMDGTIEKMSDVAVNIHKQFPWIGMVVYHELVVPGLVQFKTPVDMNWWKKNSGPVPSEQTDRLCELARKTKQWLIPGSMWETEGDKMYNTALVISPDGDIVAKYRKMFPWMPYEMGATPGNEFCVFDIPNVGRFGLCICYDMWFPETARTLAWMGGTSERNGARWSLSDNEGCASGQSTPICASFQRMPASASRSYSAVHW